MRDNPQPELCIALPSEGATEKHIDNHDWGRICTPPGERGERLPRIFVFVYFDQDKYDGYHVVLEQASRVTTGDMLQAWRQADNASHP